MLAKHERSLRRTARRYSICAADADDAFQRAMEILLVKAPPGEARELVRWMQTVTKHEALAIRRSRERQLGAPSARSGAEEEAGDWLALIPSQGAGPAERFERREAIARSREALKTLKPAELKALTLLAEGYSYAEIGEMTGFSQTKVNRCLAEGRERFRAFLSRSESGGRCAELRPVLSAFCDGEASPEETSALREHLRVCAPCRAAMRAYRAAPGATAALLPVPIAARPLLERAQEALAGAAGAAAGRWRRADGVLGLSGRRDGRRRGRRRRRQRTGDLRRDGGQRGDLRQRGTAPGRDPPRHRPRRGAQGRRPRCEPERRAHHPASAAGGRGRAGRPSRPGAGAGAGGGHADARTGGIAAAAHGGGERRSARPGGSRAAAGTAACAEQRAGRG